eukprot:CAMPEP_0195085288 /NCGR_PEP_ID=MMETSP0448-20130528/25751_1 /TAXON_ID=66468 /ORGANISM="Heterocapsa triquestra, Strain CCMP 448" /LENGTH=62 /DNA_ID=CAMNT_0040118679 /DNA_START=9 /DNA_END=193 /DNA_ORIENTATION=+
MRAEVLVDRAVDDLLALVAEVGLADSAPYVVEGAGPGVPLPTSAAGHVCNLASAYTAAPGTR